MAEDKAGSPSFSSEVDSKLSTKTPTKTEQRGLASQGRKHFGSEDKQRLAEICKVDRKTVNNWFTPKQIKEGSGVPKIHFQEVQRLLISKQSQSHSPTSKSPHDVLDVDSGEDEQPTEDFKPDIVTKIDFDANEGDYFLYVMENVQVANMFKVGVTNDLKNRLKQGRTWVPFLELRHAWIFKKSDIESDHHVAESNILDDKQLARYRMAQREWFVVKESLVEQVTNNVAIRFRGVKMSSNDVSSINA